MLQLTLRLRWRLVAATTLAACQLAAVTALAQVGSAASPINVGGYPAGAEIGFSGTSQANMATSLGGVTLFAAYAPNGPLLVRLPLPPPYAVPPDSAVPEPWRFNGVPPGTYYVALVYGIVAAPNLPAAAWTPLVVPGACTSAPGVGLLDRESAGVEPDTVRLFTTSAGGCATSYLIDVGTSPGATNLASFEQTGVLLNVGGVPAGTYYVRVRGRNQFGIGPYSAVLPVRVPVCSIQWTEIGSDITASVVGRQVTLTWTPPTPAPVVGGPVTYYEIARVDNLAPDSPPVPILLPITTTSVTATLPPGTYAVALFAGNTCRSDAIGSVLFTVP